MLIKKLTITITKMILITRISLVFNTASSEEQLLGDYNATHSKDCCLERTTLTSSSVKAVYPGVIILAHPTPKNM